MGGGAISFHVVDGEIGDWRLEVLGWYFVSNCRLSAAYNGAREMDVVHTYVNPETHLEDGRLEYRVKAIQGERGFRAESRSDDGLFKW